MKDNYNNQIIHLYLFYKQLHLDFPEDPEIKQEFYRLEKKVINIHEVNELEALGKILITECFEIIEAINLIYNSSMTKEAKYNIKCILESKKNENEKLIRLINKRIKQ